LRVIQVCESYKFASHTPSSPRGGPQWAAMTSGVVRSSYTPGVYFVNDAEWAVRAPFTEHDVSMSAGLLPCVLGHCAAPGMHCTCTVPSREACACAAAQVGERYQLVKLLGSGSFSSVCSALDAVTGEQARTRCAHACAGRSPAWPRGCPPGGCGLEKRGGGSRAGRAARALAAPSWRRNIHINMRRAGGARRARPAAAGDARRARA